MSSFAGLSTITSGGMMNFEGKGACYCLAGLISLVTGLGVPYQRYLGMSLCTRP